VRNLKRNAPVVLLISLVLMFVVSPFVDSSELEGIAYLLDASVVAVLFAAIYAEGERFTFRRFGPWAVLLAVVLRLVVTSFGDRFSDGVHRFLVVGTGAYTAGLIFQICTSLLVSVTRGKRVTGNTIAGVAAVYILIAVGFASLYLSIYVGQGPASFNGIPSVQDTRLDLNDLAPEFAYYSVVTQTTVGYGDITPASQVARGFAMVQTIIGQLFIAIVLARIVAMELAQRGMGDDQ
jgi:hypothetical protein